MKMEPETGSVAVVSRQSLIIETHARIANLQQS